MVREIFTFDNHAFTYDHFLFFLGAAAQKKEDNPNKQIYLSFTDKIKHSSSFLRKIFHFAYEKNIGILINGKEFLPTSLSKEKFELILKEITP
ncbi:MAG: hypothetical protein ACXAC7_20340 [Candidatus Hodarchaeales archaeon]|jgi:hypothetical protein